MQGDNQKHNEVNQRHVLLQIISQAYADTRTTEHMGVCVSN